MYDNDYAVMKLFRDRSAQLAEEARIFRLLKEGMNRQPALWQQAALWAGERMVRLGWSLEQLSGVASRQRGEIRRVSLWD